jgi:hypothetical protein
MDPEMDFPYIYGIDGPSRVRYDQLLILLNQLHKVLT